MQRIMWGQISELPDQEVKHNVDSLGHERDWYPRDRDQG